MTTPSDERQPRLLRGRTLDREIVSLALPAVGSHFAVTVHLWIDTWWVGRMDEFAAPLAALAVATFTRWIFGSLVAIVGTGAVAIVGRSVGAGRTDEAAWLGYQSLLTSALLGVVAAGIGWWGAPLVYDWVSASAEVSAAGTVYVRIYWAAAPILFVERAAGAVFRSHGDTRTPFVIACGGLAMNAVLDPLLLFGGLGIPALGIAGVSLATVLASVATTAACVWQLGRRGWIRTAVHDPVPGGARLSRDVFTRILRVGLPVAYSGVFFSAIYLELSRIIGAAGGEHAQAALGLGHRGESVAFMLSAGYAAATASIVGRRLGEGDPAAAGRAAWRAGLQCAALCGAWAVILFAAADELAAWIVEPGAVQALAASYFRIIALCLVPQAIESVLEGAFGGAGRTVPPMLVTIVFSVVRVPLAAWLVGPAGLDVTAVWWMISATAVLRGVTLALWFARGTWTTTRV